MTPVRNNRDFSFKTNAKKRHFLFNFRKKRHNRRIVLSQRSFKNPYFLKDRLPKRTRAPKIKITMGFLSICGIIGIFLFHPYFYINQTVIKGLQQTPIGEINNLVSQVLESKRFLFFKNKNIFTVDLNAIEKVIKEKYAVEDIKTSKDLPHILKIEIQEKQPQLVFENQRENYFVDADGKIIQEIKDLSGDLFSSIPHFQLSTSGTYKISDSILPIATEEFIIYIFNNLPKKTGVSLSKAVLANEEGRVVNLVTTEGWKIIVDRQADWNKQIQVLTIILRDKIKNNRSDLHYIDVRYENRSYFQ